MFFFFKQKTAYEMRISDWSSDVCSSDLVPDGDPKAEQAMLLKIASQPVSGESTSSTGADVSRFQRSSVPGKAERGAPSMADAAGGIPVGEAVITGQVVRVCRSEYGTVGKVWVKLVSLRWSQYQSKK